jgi:TrmH family RNA methyltransferase
VLIAEEAARLSVVLVATRNPLNMGAAARAMSNFGFADLRVVRPYEAAFRDARSAVGALTLLENAREFPSVADAVADCSLVVGTSAGSRHRDAQHPIYRLEAAALQMQEALTHHRVALLFGSEKFGLSNDDMSHCHWLLHIPARAEHASMNLGQAVAICLYELIRDDGATHQGLQGQSAPIEPATGAQTEMLSKLALEMLDTSGYLNRHPRANLDAELRRLILRLNPNSKDAEAVLGMLRQALWKVRKDPPG